MPCYTPNIGKPPTFDSKIKFYNHLPKDVQKRKVLNGDAVPLPCGKCSGCRLDNARQFAVRSVHESQQYSNNCFVTLTYSPERLKSDSLNPKDFVDFAKRLRKRFDGIDLVEHQGKRIKPIRIMYAGEYGDNLGRPHFHACIYNFDFDDKDLLFTTKAGNRLYTSPTLEKLWGKGMVSIGNLTYDSASYTARYVMKKITGDIAKSHYDGKLPEFARHPSLYGLGLKWLESHYRDVYPHDYVVVMKGSSEAFKMRPPRYYDEWLKKNRPDLFEEVKFKRLEKTEENLSNFNFENLAKKEKREQKRLKELVRHLDKLNQK